MKRLWLGVGILTAFFALSLWNGLAVGKCHEALALQAEQAQAAALSGDLQAGTQLLRQAQQRWDARWKLMAVITDHEPMEDIDGMFSQVRAYGAAGQREAFAAGCAWLAQLLEAVGEAHTPMWWNLL